MAPGCRTPVHVVPSGLRVATTYNNLLQRNTQAAALWVPFACAPFGASAHLIDRPRLARLSWSLAPPDEYRHRYP